VLVEVPVAVGVEGWKKGAEGVVAGATISDLTRTLDAAGGWGRAAGEI